MSLLSIPTTSALPAHLRVPATNPEVIRIISRVSRPSLLSLALDWLDDRNQFLCGPYLLEEDAEEDDADLFPPAESVEELRELYDQMMERRGARRDLVDRILEGDWRHGLSLYQLAMADLQYLYDHPKSQKWTALKVVSMRRDADDEMTPPTEDELPCVPRFHPQTFLQNLQRHTLPDVKVHYNLDRPPGLPMILLRIYVLDSPYNTSLAIHGQSDDAAFDSSKTIYVAFPDASPYIYVSLAAQAGAASSSGEARSLRKLILDAIPKAFSKSREWYKLEAANLTAKTLEALVARRGAGRTNAAGGGWEIYAEKNRKDTPLNTQLPVHSVVLNDVTNTKDASQRSTGLKRKQDDPEDVQRRRKRIAQGRFGNTARIDDGKGIERVDIRMEDEYPRLAAADGADFSDDEADVRSVVARRREAAADRPSLATDAPSHSDRTAIAAALERPAADDEELGTTWRPEVRLTFTGSHVFAGIRELVELGVIDGERMPGWMTGEDGVSVGVVRDGRIRGHHGAGL